MKKNFLVFLTFLLLTTSVFAHRLNEYLEATTISLSQKNVSMELRLTPGVSVAADILKDIDTNGDNQISATEQNAYIKALSRNFSLMMDGHDALLKLISASFPTTAAMRKGVGDITIKFESPIEQQSPSHRLKLVNKHYSRIAVYLVNCLLPADTTIHVASQTRNADQSIYQLNFTIGGAQAAISADQQQLLDKVNQWAIIKTYFVHGIRHILTGYDHLLFLCALVLGASSLWDLIKIVTAFTLAHSITLTLATFGLAHLPVQVVEPAIAASIVFVAIQNIAWPKQTGGYKRMAVAFYFGLFHGLGFAGGLLELMHAMPTNLIVFAIIGFSLGVEAGNQLVLLPLYGFLQWIRQVRNKAEKPQRLLTFQRYASGAVAVAGMYYLCTDLYACL